MWLRTLTNTTALLLIAGSIGMLVGDTGTRVSYDDRLFAVADNLFVVGAGLSCILAVIYIRKDQATDVSWSPRRRVTISLVSGAVAAGVVLVANSFYYAFIGVFQLAFSLGVGLNIGVILFNVTTPSRSRNVSWSSGVVSTRPSLIYRAYALLALLIIAGIVLRMFTPGIGFLTWVVVPINLFLTPGLSLALALLPESVSWLERILFAPALSIGALLMAVMWLNLMGIPMQTPAFFIITAGVTLVGFLVSLYRRRALTSG